MEQSTRMQTCPNNFANEKPIKLFIIEENKANHFAISYKLLEIMVSMTLRKSGQPIYPRTAHLPELIGVVSPKQHAIITEFTPSHPIKAFNWFPK